MAHIDDLKKIIDEKKDEKKVDFECRCGCTEYLTHREDNGIMGSGFRSWITGYSCAGCTVLFGDPEKYSKKSVKKE